MGDLQVAEMAAPTWRRIAAIQKMGLALFLLLLLAGLAGLLGKGPLSSTRAGEKDSLLWADYCRFVRYHGPTEIQIHLGAPLTTNGLVQLQISKEFAAEMEIDHVQPKPIEITGGADSFVYAFKVRTNETVQITLQVQPNHFGKLNYQLGVAGGPSFSLKHFAYP